MEQRYSQSFESIRAGEPAGDLLRKAAGVAPTPRQLAWQRLELTAFIHFGMNTFTDREWGDGAESPQLFNPTDLDADQWVRVLKDAGFKGLILTCKHHDGFCLWPSAHTTHSVKQSPWKNGGGDVVREVSDACRRAGLRFGIYLSPWDRHDPRYGDSPAYNAFFLAQLDELLTGYGEIFEVWFDGACAEGPCGKRQEYDWAAYFALIRRLQPDAVISIEGPDVRWVGNEAGKGRREEWSVYPYGRRLDAEDGTFLMNAGDCTAPDLGSDRLLASLDEGWEYLYWYPAQVDTSIRPGWFYHTWEDDKVKPLHELAAIYRQSVGNNAQLLLNIPPDTRGRLSDKDAARLEEFGRYLRAAYGRNLAEGRPLEVRRDGDAYVVSLTLDEPVAFNQAVLMEDITQGQHVGAFTLRAYCGDELTASADGATVGYKKILPLPAAVADRVDIVVTACRAAPVFTFVGLYDAPTVAQPPSITRSQAGLVSIAAGPDARIRWSVDGGAWRDYTGPFAFPRSGRIRAEAWYDAARLFGENGPSAEAVFGLLKTSWTLKSHTGQTATGFSADNLTDDDKPYVCFEGELPLEVTVDLGQSETVRGFAYRPVDDIFDFSANVYAYALYLSADGETFFLADRGVFDNLRNNPVLQVRDFGRSYTARAFRLVAESGFDARRVSLGKLSLL